MRECLRGPTARKAFENSSQGLIAPFEFRANLLARLSIHNAINDAQACASRAHRIAAYVTETQDQNREGDNSAWEEMAQPLPTGRLVFGVTQRKYPGTR